MSRSRSRSRSKSSDGDGAIYVGRDGSMVSVPPKLARKRSVWIEKAVSFKERNKQPMHLKIDDLSDVALFAVTEYLRCNSRPIYEMRKEDRDALIEYFQLRELEETLRAEEFQLRELEETLRAEEILARAEITHQKCTYCGAFFTEKNNLLKPTCKRKPPRDTFPFNGSARCTVCKKAENLCECIVYSLHTAS